MNTDTLLRNTYKFENDIAIPYTKEEIADRRRLLKRILKNSKFESCTNEQLDEMTAQQLGDGGYMINDFNGYEWKI